MLLADGWEDYEVIDTSSGEKLERWGEYILVRPDPQVIWTTDHSLPEWKKKNAHYHRSSKGGGQWEFINLPEQWQIGYDLSGGDFKLKFNLKPFQFKHTGVFPEQAVNWEWVYKRIMSWYDVKSDFSSSDVKADKQSEKNGQFGGDKFKVLNLFAYTGGATLACAAAGAAVTHVDASKGMVGWAKENASSSGLGDADIRYLVDDCVKLVEREIRRGNHYEGIIMDPPSYGRGPKGEIWKIEEKVFDLINLCSKLMSKNSSFFLINSYTTGLQPGVLKYMLDLILSKKFGGVTEADEIGIPVSGSREGSALPCGASGRWYL
ncbi:MAG: class I SAM-dependent methyltransferase [Eubacterium sp.]|nr:class I SAM-dependent methyltransferase [Eubacterium sp.]